MVKIYVDAGHGGSDPGAVGNGIKEKDITLKIAKKVQKYLKEYKNVSVKMSRTGDTYPTLAQRTNEANAWGADAFISIHINSGGGVGYEDFIYNGNVSTKTESLQNEIHNQVSKHFDTNRGKKRANLHVCRESKMPAVLTENGFIDNANDAANMKDNSFLDKVAKSHAEGIAKAFNMTKGSNTSQNNKKPSKPTTSDYTGNSVVDYLKSIGQDSGFANRKKLATKHGISNYNGTASQNTQLLKKLRSGGEPSKSKTSYKVGSTVTLKKSATHFATGQSILNSAKGKKYKIIQVKSDRVLLDKIMSWVKKSDVK